MNLRLGLNVLSLFQLGLLFAQKVANSLYGFRMKTGFTLEILQLLFFREKTFKMDGLFSLGKSLLGKGKNKGK